jgi:hypothetical protein
VAKLLEFAFPPAFVKDFAVESPPPKAAAFVKAFPDWATALLAAFPVPRDSEFPIALPLPFAIPVDCAPVNNCYFWSI